LPDYARLFSRAGLILRKRDPSAPWVGVLDQEGPPTPRRWRSTGVQGAVAVTPAAVRIPDLVAWGTPAFDSGLEAGDVLTEVDGKPIGSLDDWHEAVRARKPRQRMDVTYTRHGAKMTTTVLVAEDPSVEVVTVESTGARLSAEQKAFRNAWLSSRRKQS
jgi:S1-C subfamily serine protease